MRHITICSKQLNLLQWGSFVLSRTISLRKYVLKTIFLFVQKRKIFKCEMVECVEKLQNKYIENYCFSWRIRFLRAFSCFSLICNFQFMAFFNVTKRSEVPWFLFWLCASAFFHFIIFCISIKNNENLVLNINQKLVVSNSISFNLSNCATLAYSDLN